jgi:hypothetical protein
MTVNSSRSGVLIESSANCPHVEIGDTIQVHIELPVIEFLPPRCIACGGQVVRLELIDTRTRIAVRFEKMQFQDASVSNMVVGRQMPTFCM